MSGVRVPLPTLRKAFRSNELRKASFLDSCNPRRCNPFCNPEVGYPATTGSPGFRGPSEPHPKDSGAGLDPPGRDLANPFAHLAPSRRAGCCGLGPTLGSPGNIRKRLIRLSAIWYQPSMNLPDKGLTEGATTWI